MNFNLGQKVEWFYAVIATINYVISEDEMTATELLNEIKKDINRVFYSIDKIDPDNSEFSNSINALSIYNNAYNCIKSGIVSGAIDEDDKSADIMKKLVEASIIVMDDINDTINTMNEILNMFTD